MNHDSINTFQDWTESLSVYPGSGTGHPVAMLYAVLGLSGEVGEITEKVKKALRGDGLSNPADKGPSATLYDNLSAINGSDMIKKELGDVLFYCARVARENGWLLSDVIRANVEKLEARKKAGTIKGSGDNR